MTLRRIGRLCLAFAIAAGARAADADIYSRIDRISAQVRESMKKYDVPGVSVAVFSDFRIEWAKGYGVADVETKQPVDTLTLFQAASISKPVACLATMRLVQEKRLSLDTNVNEYLTSWKLPENDLTRATPVTLRHIMSHTGGLTVHGFRGYDQGQAIPTVLQILDGRPPANSEPVRVTVAPGTKFEYSGGGSTIMQQVLLDITRLPFTELMRILVLDPTGMGMSTYQQPLPDSAVPFASTGHEPHGQAIKGKRHIYPELIAAGLSTTPSDLARFAMAIQRARMGLPGAILSKDLARQMTTPSIPGSYGLGFEPMPMREKEKRHFGHTGGNVGYRCMLEATLEGGNGVVVMTNGDEFKAVAEIVRKVMSEYGW